MMRLPTGFALNKKHRLAKKLVGCWLLNEENIVGKRGKMMEKKNDTPTENRN